MLIILKRGRRDDMRNRLFILLLLSFLMINSGLCFADSSKAINQLNKNQAGNNNEKNTPMNRRIVRYCEFYKGRFDYRWWSFYARGLCYAYKGELKKAEQDLNNALHQKKGEQWDAEIYGYHYMDYFPYRELGIVFYMQKKYNKAEERLVESLSIEKTARAEFYLEKTRRAMIKDISDGKPPTVTLKLKGNEKYCNKFYMLFEGVAEDENFVGSIKVEDEYVPIDVPSKKIQFKKVIPIKPGKNNIGLTIADLKGNTTYRDFTIYGDFTSPSVRIDRAEVINRGSKKYIFISGEAYDNHKLKKILFLNDSKIRLKEDKKFSITYKNKANEELILKVGDVSGNYNIINVPIQAQENNQMSMFTASLETDIFNDRNFVQNGHKHNNVTDEENKDVTDEIAIVPIVGSAYSYAESELIRRTSRKLSEISEFDHVKTFCDSIQVRVTEQGAEKYKIRINKEKLETIDGYASRNIQISNKNNNIDIVVIDPDKNEYIYARRINIIKKDISKEKLNVCFDFDYINCIGDDMKDAFEGEDRQEQIKRYFMSIIEEYGRFNIFSNSCDECSKCDWGIKYGMTIDNYKTIQLEIEIVDRKEEGSVGKIKTYLVYWDGVEVKADSAEKITSIGIDERVPTLKEIFIKEKIIELFNENYPIEKGFLVEKLENDIVVAFPIDGFPPSENKIPSQMRINLNELDYIHDNMMFIGPILNEKEVIKGMVEKIIEKMPDRYDNTKKYYKSSIIETIEKKAFPNWWVSTL